MKEGDYVSVLLVGFQSWNSLCSYGLSTSSTKLSLSCPIGYTGRKEIVVITIVQNKCRATLKITNDETFEEATVMLQTDEEANTLMYNLLRGIMKGEN